MGLKQTRVLDAFIFLRGRMAIYSLNHKSIGKVTQKQEYTAAAHIRYITRSKACAGIEASRMPETAQKAQQWLCKGEDADRKNARVCDKVMLALPKELNAKQQAELVREFAEETTNGRAPWFAAFHTKEKDKNNPHCHLVIRDRDPDTGKRACNMSEKGSTDRMRELWQKHANKVLERSGSRERIDRRTLKEQGQDRRPQIHEGVRARKMRERGAEFKSKVIQFPNAATAKSKGREVDYPTIDNGQTRAEYNAKVIALAKKQEERGLVDTTRKAKFGQAYNQIESVRRKLRKRKKREEEWDCEWDE